MLNTGNTYDFEVEILSPMGWVKVLANVAVTGETSFTGSARLLGFTVELTDCVRDGDHVRFAASPGCPSGSSGWRSRRTSPRTAASPASPTPPATGPWPSGAGC